MTSRYVYLGDAMTDPALKGQPCDPVRRPDGRCIVGRGVALVRFEDGVRAVLRRRLRLLPLVQPTEASAGARGLDAGPSGEARPDVVRGHRDRGLGHEGLVLGHVGAEGAAVQPDRSLSDHRISLATAPESTGVCGKGAYAKGTTRPLGTGP